MSRYSDIDPQDMNPDTGRPYANYSSPSLDSSFHDGEMDADDDDFDGVDNRELLQLYRAGDDTAGEELLRRQARAPHYDDDGFLRTALHEGAVAGRQGKPVDACPYSPSDSDPARSWLEGRARVLEQGA